MASPYLLPRGGGYEEIFLRQSSTYVIPLKAYSVVLIPHIGGGRFHVPPSPIPATTKSRCNYICKQVISILILTSYEPWTTTSHIWSSAWTELSVKGNSSHPNRWKQSHCRSRPPHCLILPHILHPLIPRHFHLWYLTIRLSSQTVYVSVIMTSNSFYFVKLPTNSGPCSFR